MTSGVRPTAVFAPMLASCSLTRCPTKESEKSPKEPIAGSTVHVPERSPDAVPLDDPAGAGEPMAAGSEVADAPGVVPSDTGAGPASRRNRYHNPPPPRATTTIRAAASARG